MQLVQAFQRSKFNNHGSLPSSIWLDCINRHLSSIVGLIPARHSCTQVEAINTNIPAIVQKFAIELTSLAAMVWHLLMNLMTSLTPEIS